MYYLITGYDGRAVSMGNAPQGEIEGGTIHEMEGDMPDLDGMLDDYILNSSGNLEYDPKDRTDLPVPAVPTLQDLSIAVEELGIMVAEITAMQEF